MINIENKTDIINSNKENSNKEFIRKEILSKRKILTNDFIDKASTAICKKVINSEFFQNSNGILLYIPINNEVDIKLLIHEALKHEKKVFLPRLINKSMDFFEFTGFSNLKMGQYEILVPISNKTYNLFQLKNIVSIVPGLAFDISKNRLGYGGGYYDRFFKKNTEIFKIGICYDFQIVENITHEKYDIKLNLIISENQTI